MEDFKIDWSSLIVDIVKKKDLDTEEFADCWTDDYDWTKLDLFVINNFFEELVGYGEVESDRVKLKISKKGLALDLTKYKKHISKTPYCENCFKEGLRSYVIDGYGSVFCCEKCFKDSKEFRDINIEETPITIYKEGVAIN